MDSFGEALEALVTADGAAAATATAGVAEETWPVGGTVFVDATCMAVHVLAGMGESATQLVDYGLCYSGVADGVELQFRAWRDAGLKIHVVADAEGVDEERFFFSREEPHAAVNKQDLLNEVHGRISKLDQEEGWDLTFLRAKSTEAGKVLISLCAAEVRKGNQDVFVVAQCPELFFVSDIQYAPLRFCTNVAARVFTVAKVAVFLGIPLDEMVSLGLAIISEALSGKSTSELIDMAKRSAIKFEDTMDSGCLLAQSVFENETSVSYTKFGAGRDVESGSNGWSAPTMLSAISPTGSSSSMWNNDAATTDDSGAHAVSPASGSVTVGSGPSPQTVSAATAAATTTNTTTSPSDSLLQDAMKSFNSGGLLSSLGIGNSSPSSATEASITEVERDGALVRDATTDAPAVSSNVWGSATTSSASTLAGETKADTAGKSQGDTALRAAAQQLADWLQLSYGGSTKAAHLGRFYKANPGIARMIKAMSLGSFVEMHSDLLSWDAANHTIAIRGAAPQQPMVQTEATKRAATALAEWLNERHGCSTNAANLGIFYRRFPDVAEQIRATSLSSFVRLHDDLLAWDPKTRVISAKGANKNGGGVGGAGSSSSSAFSSGAPGQASLQKWIEEQHKTDAEREAFFESNPVLAAMVVAEWLNENYNGVANVANLGIFYRKNPVLANFIRSQTLGQFVFTHSDILEWNPKTRFLSAKNRDMGRSPKGDTGNSSTGISGSSGIGTFNGATAASGSSGSPSGGSGWAGTPHNMVVDDAVASRTLADWLRREFDGQCNAANLGSFYKNNPAIARHIKTKTLQSFVDNNRHVLNWNPKTHLLSVAQERPSYASAASKLLGVNTEQSVTAFRAGTESGQRHGPVARATESQVAARELVHWLRREYNGGTKASALGVFYRGNPEAARLIRTKTLGEFCKEHSSVFSWDPTTHLIALKPGAEAFIRKFAGSSAESDGQLQHSAAAISPQSPSVAKLDEVTYALCALRTWLLEHCQGRTPISKLVKFGAQHTGPYNTITMMGLNNFAARFPRWIVLDKDNEQLVLAEIHG
ncbi:Uncharacterized protein SCF082_LOCUS51053 [Durusdinium trenchii]|uniref:Uncharacterized protein n=1 Tax=Durusdinium trenchii TaxID=1381693 RepID=A0ABP0SC04_9DINO